MLLTIQKLQTRLKEAAQAVEDEGQLLSPLFWMPATGSMAPAPDENDPGWKRLEAGQMWGMTHGTCWLYTTLPPLSWRADQTPVLQLPWDQREEDSLLRKLEATAFLDNRAIGAFDWRHPVLALAEGTTTAALLQDGAPHILRLQVYTREPLVFQGLFLRIRYEKLYQFHRITQTLLDSCLTLPEDAPQRHHLLEQLNQAYLLLDLLAGWKGPQLQASLDQALAHLKRSIDMLAEVGETRRPQITISGHAHLDVAWLWPYWRTHQKIAHTVANVLALMERYPNYHYSQSQPQLLQWLKEDLPELYARVKERAREGRFEVVGAMWVEADCNLTSGESLVRQIMHGTRFIREEFGITPKVIWLPDVFGYSAALPQIMRLCNIPCFMTTKISWNQFNRMPVDTFRWRGIDGSEVLTHFVTAPDVHSETTYYTYNGPLKPSDMLGTWKNYRQQAINEELLYLGGWGDGGGGPAEDQLDRAQIMGDTHLPAFPRVRMGRVDAFFAELYERLWDNPHLPTWVGELYLEYHRGTYTSQARTKQANRRSELLYRDVELLNAWASLYGMPSRQQELNEGWKLILLNQFHDVLPGSSIHEVYEDVAKIYQQIKALAEPIRAEALTYLQKSLVLDQDESAGLFLWNTLSWKRSEAIQLSGNYSTFFPDAQLASDWENNPVTLIDGVELPSYGVLFARRFPETSSNEKATISRHEEGHITLQNAFYELHLDEHGEIVWLYDRQARREVLAPGLAGNQIIAYEDRPLNFDAWDIDIYYEEKAYPVREQVQMRILEEGPVRATVEVERRFMNSRITQRISLWSNSRRIDFATEIDWHEHQLLLKAAFPVAINATRATYEIQFGHVERPTHRNTSWDLARFEVCAHRWADLSEGAYGVSLLNDSKYGHDIHDNIMRLTLLKSAISPDAEADQGLHRFTYSLFPHQDDWRKAEIVRRAYELNVPVLATQTSQAANLYSEAFSSFLHTDCEHVVVETVKPAEDGQGLIIRLYEAHNQRGSGTLTFATELLEAAECNLLEEYLADVEYQGNSLSFQIRPFEIKTFRVRLAAS